MTGNVSHGAAEITEDIDNFGYLESFMRIPFSGEGVNLKSGAILLNNQAQDPLADPVQVKGNAAPVHGRWLE